MKTWIAMTVLLIASVARASDNVVILLDTSPSMEDKMTRANVNKMVAAQQALLGVLDQIPAETNVGFLTFAGWESNLDPFDKNRISQAIRRSTPGGNGTPLGTYMKAGADALLKKRAESKGYGTYRLLVVTDGQPTPESEESLMLAIMPDLLFRGILLDTIGVDMQQNHALSRFSHKYMRADDPASFQNAVKQAMAEVIISKGTSLGSEDDFKLIAPLPDTLVVKVINKYAEGMSWNQPIGEAPPPPPKPPVVANSDTSGGNVAPAATAAPVAETMGLGTVLMIVMGSFGAIAVFFIMAMRSRK